MAALGSPRRSSDSFSYSTRGTPRRSPGQSLDVDVNAIQQRARDALLVAADHAQAAGALVNRVIEIAARAGIHRSEQHKGGREGERTSGAGDGDHVILHRLAPPPTNPAWLMVWCGARNGRCRISGVSGGNKSATE
jgi:hypothetical protein